LSKINNTKLRHELFFVKIGGSPNEIRSSKYFSAEQWRVSQISRNSSGSGGSMQSDRQIVSVFQPPPPLHHDKHNVQFQTMPAVILTTPG
jgi:hypothetical protein